MKKVIIKVSLLILFTLLISFLGIKYYLSRTVLLKEVTLEAGISKLKMADFYKNRKYNLTAKFVTDISSIDLNKVNDYDIYIIENNKSHVVKLHLVDTTKPKVIFKDLIKNKDYIINAEDFIEKVDDISSLRYEIDSIPTLDKYKDYEIDVKVIDKYNNITSKKCKLTIAFIKSEIIYEIGDNLSKEDLLYDNDYAKYILDSDLKRIKESDPGIYELNTKVDDKIYTTKIIVQDTKAPTLKLKEVKIYLGDTIKGKEEFIDSVYDASGEVITNLKSNYDLKKEGSQNIIIEAIDKNGNKVEKSTTLNIIKDNDGPVFSGLKELTVKKKTAINYESGVSAYDKKDGKVAFSFNASNVDVNSQGTYYVTYTAKDKSGNTTTKKRKIIIEHDKNDLNNLIDKYFKNAGNTYETARLYVQKNIKYNSNWGGDDPVWYGLTTFTGNCYVHALTYKAFLDKLGYENKLIWTTDKTHYWNLVKINGVWKHSDSTPGTKHTMISAENDETRYANLQGRDWDRSKWPEAL